jgi:hypothetical protein
MINSKSKSKKGREKREEARRSMGEGEQRREGRRGEVRGKKSSGE